MLPLWPFSITICWEADRRRLKAEKHREALRGLEKQREQLGLADKKNGRRMHFSEQEGR